MGRPSKGSNTFKEYQEQKQVRREELIRNYLTVLKASNAKFQYVTKLAYMVAIHIGQVEGTECNQSTLLRNPRYKALLLSYLANTMKPGAKNLVAKPSSDPGTQVVVTQLQLANRNLSNENQRLKGHIATLSEQAGQASLMAPGKTPVNLAEVEANFVLTCQALLRVLENLGDFVSVDTRTKQIRDASKRTDNVIADERIAGPFVDWLQANRTK